MDGAGGEDAGGRVQGDRGVAIAEGINFLRGRAELISKTT